VSRAKRGSVDPLSTCPNQPEHCRKAMQSAALAAKDIDKEAWEKEAKRHPTYLWRSGVFASRMRGTNRWDSARRPEVTRSECGTGADAW
jgi:hypothetical protein